VSFANVEHESELLKQRSAELAAELDNALPAVDRSGIAAALAESRRFADAAAAARAEVSRRLAHGLPAGVALGPVGVVRRVPSTPSGRDPDPQLRGRVAITAELLRYHHHRRDSLAPAYRAAYGAAAEAFEARPSLVAASKGHLAVLRQRGNFTAEGGEELQAALTRFLDAAGVLRAGVRDADEIAAAAEGALENLRSLPALAELEDEAGPMSVTSTAQWVAGRISAALGAEPVDAATGAPVAVPSRGRK
jgi:hypothetical protein